MSSNAWIMFTIGAIILYGGLIASLWNAVSKQKQKKEIKS